MNQFTVIVDGNLDNPFEFVTRKSAVAHAREYSKRGHTVEMLSLQNGELLPDEKMEEMIQPRSKKNNSANPSAGNAKLHNELIKLSLLAKKLAKQAATGDVKEELMLDISSSYSRINSLL